MFTKELSNKITELFVERGITVEGEFFTWTNFNELNSGDLVCLPMNPRAGVYEVTKRNIPGGFEDDFPGNTILQLTRNSSSVWLSNTDINSGIWLYRFPKNTVDWSFWEDSDSTLKMDIFNYKVDWSQTENYSNWYDGNEWRSSFKPGAVPRDIEKVIIESNYSERN